MPAGLLQRLSGNRSDTQDTFAKETQRVEQLAMAAAMEAKQKLRYQPGDVTAEKCGYDIESPIPGTSKLRFIEVKRPIEGADTVTVTKNEILTALNKPEDYILALVQVPKTEHQVRDNDCEVRYLRNPFYKEPDFGVTSVNYSWKELWQRSTDPSRVKN